jgi:hypothetical protein
MSLDDLTRVVEPPASPLERPSAERWSEAEAALNLQLPDDYKALVDAYGSGMFNDFLLVFVPFSGNKNINLLEVQRPIMDAYRTMAQQGSDAARYPAYPDEGGLFPWARTDNGDVFYWRTEGEPDSWPTVLIESRFGFVEEYQQPATTLLAGLLDGSITSQAFPSPDDFGDDPFFESRA